MMQKSAPKQYPNPSDAAFDMIDYSLLLEKCVLALLSIRVFH
jgi:hypothetical protein